VSSVYEVGFARAGKHVTRLTVSRSRAGRIVHFAVVAVRAVAVFRGEWTETKTNELLKVIRPPTWQARRWTVAWCE
jgi:hypothetical protein